jgi:hypothetical protein
MKLSQLSASLLAVATLAVLAACGGGGGGGSVTPPGGGGGGGGGTPPSSSPTTSPTTHPTTSPTTSPTNPPSGNIAANMSLNAALSYDGPPNNPQIGYQNGNDGWYKLGTVTSDNTDGDTATGGTGTNTVDTNLTCTITATPPPPPAAQVYNATAFVGILVNNGSPIPTDWAHSGVAFALPDAIGMMNPNEPSNPQNGGQITGPASGGCYYQINTESESGTVHLMNPSAPQVAGNGPATAMYSLQNFFDVWGMTPAQIGAAIGQTGTPTIIAGPANATVQYAGGTDDEVTSYSVVSNPSQLMLSRHMAVWIIFGGVPSGGPPAVIFTSEI